MRGDAAVIFDCDGVLLDLTAAEEDIFFAAFADHCDPAALSRDWNSYKIRNDDDIIDEIMANHAIAPELKPVIAARYLDSLSHALTTNTLKLVAIPGAAHLLSQVSHLAHAGLATANYLVAAKLRLGAAGLWQPVSNHAAGAEGGGHKHQILARSLATFSAPPARIIYVGDNLNDHEAALVHGLPFIAFSVDPARRATLATAGAEHLSADHATTLLLIRHLLNAAKDKA
jgi:phosphoglycolate phosphatase-like HAD superfamily hydrolase